MDYKLKNRDGVETTYAKDKIKIPAATGDSMVVFTQGEAQVEKSVDIAKNGAFSIEPDAGYAFVKKVSGTVAVPAPEPVLQEKTVNITSNGQTSVTPDEGKAGLSKVDITVAVPTPAPKLQKKSISITANGTGSVLPDAGNDGLSEVDYTVDVPASTPVLQEKTVTITANGTTEVTPDSGQDGLSKVAITASVPSIIRGSISEVIPVAYEILKKARTLPGVPYGVLLKYGVPVFFVINVSGSNSYIWATLRYSENKLTSDTLVWESRVFPKKETGLGVDISFAVQFYVENGVVDTDDYYFTVIGTGDDAIPANLNKGICATISDWLP